MPKYIIYQIVCNNAPDQCYIGSTKNYIRRKREHKKNSICKNTKLYETIREFGGWNNWEISVIEQIECDTSLPARIREQFYIDQKKANLNFKCAVYSAENEKRTSQNYYQKNKEKFKERSKEYYNKKNEEWKQYWIERNRIT